MLELDVKNDGLELKEILAERLKIDLNKIKHETKGMFGLEEEPLIFHFDRIFGPDYFFSETQNKPSYLSNTDLIKFSNLSDRLDGEKIYDLQDALVSVRFSPDEEHKSSVLKKILFWRKSNGTSYKWIFFNGFEVANNSARGGKEMFQFGIISKDHEVGREVLNKVSSYLQNVLQEYFVH